MQKTNKTGCQEKIKSYNCFHQNVTKAEYLRTTIVWHRYTCN